MFKLESISKNSKARTGELKTAHGHIQTPFFMPIATRGAVKTLSSFDIERLGSPILLSNTYHLWLRPGMEVMENIGGLHKFMDWEGIILTDSGGFQIFSLEGLRKLSEKGVEFQSHIDGKKLFMSPEDCMDIQRMIGSDICMVLDVCTKLPATKEDLTDALELTERWAKRSKAQFEKTREGALNPHAKLFGIVQGGTDIELRKKSLEGLMNIGFDGYALGGLSVGEPFEDACRVLDAVEEAMPKEKPRYFMGGAKPDEIVAYVKRGIDMFDCVLPTRNARHGSIYRFVHEDLNTPDFFEVLHVTNEKYKSSTEKLVTDRFSNVDDELSRYSLGYLRHLFSVNEVLAMRLATMVNLRFYLELMKRIRKGIEEGMF